MSPLQHNYHSDNCSSVCNLLGASDFGKKSFKSICKHSGFPYCICALSLGKMYYVAYGVILAEEIGTK